MKQGISRAFVRFIVSKSIMVNSVEMESFQFGVILSWDVSTGHGLM